MPTREIASAFNDLRQDIVLLYELKLALANCEYELQTLRHRHGEAVPGQVIVYSCLVAILISSFRYYHWSTAKVPANDGWTECLPYAMRGLNFLLTTIEKIFVLSLQ